MNVTTDYVNIEIDPTRTIKAMMTQIEDKMSMGLELKSHVTDGYGHIIMTYTPAGSAGARYKYHIESVTVESNAKAMVAKLDEVNERMSRAGYTQKSMFLDGAGNFIITFLINDKRNNKQRRSSNSSTRSSSRGSRY